MASSSRPLTLFLDLNDPISSAGPKANHFTLTSCMETVTAVTKLAHRLQNRTSELHQVNAQLSLLQRMYKDARTTSMARFGATSFLAFDSQRGVVALDESMGAGASRVAQGDKKKKKTME
ncbi:hypothetical protein ACSBR1_023883 [Camellia fascicularis]